MGKRADEMKVLRDHTRTSHAQRTGTLRRLCEGVHQTLQQFQSDGQRMATEQRNRLREFTSVLRDTVAATRNEFQADNAAAHAAWFGSETKTRTRK